MSTTNHQTTTITCDGPSCKPVALTITEDPNTVPDAFARFIKVQISPYMEKLFEFCGKACLLDYMEREYVEPQSPLEKAEAASRKEVAAITSRFEQPALSQADGEAA